MKNIVSRNFIWIIIVFSILGFFEPKLVIWAKGYIPLLLGIIMFGIGYSFEGENIKKTLNYKKMIGVAVIARYLVMPTTGFIIGITLNLPLDYLTGLVLLASCPGGTAAGLMSVFSKANVTLTICLTILTTIIAPFVIPCLIYFFLHKHISIPVIDIMKNISFIVLFPLTIGFSIKNLIRNSYHLSTVLPIISAFAIAFVVACVIGLTKDYLIYSRIVFLPVLLLNVFGYFSGLMLANLSKCNIAEKKSLIFEYGMFDTALGVVIATSFFNPLVALPSVFFSVIQNLTAPIIVRFYNKP